MGDPVGRPQGIDDATTYAVDRKGLEVDATRWVIAINGFDEAQGAVAQQVVKIQVLRGGDDHAPDDVAHHGSIFQDQLFPVLWRGIGSSGGHLVSSTACRHVSSPWVQVP